MRKKHAVFMLFLGVISKSRCRITVDEHAMGVFMKWVRLNWVGGQAACVPMNTGDMKGVSSKVSGLFCFFKPRNGFVSQSVRLSVTLLN